MRTRTGLEPSDPGCQAPEPARPPTPAPKSTGPDRGAYVRLVIVLGFLSATGALSTDMYLPAFPGIAADLGTGASQVQATLAGSLIGLGLGQLLLGPLTDAWGRRRPVLVGCLLHAVTSLLCAVAPTIEILVLLRVVQGLAGAAGMVAALAVVRDLHRGELAATLMSRLVLILGLAPVLAPNLGALVLIWTSWRGIFVMLAALGVAMLVVSLAWLPETHPPASRSRLRPSAVLHNYGALARDPIFVTMGVIVGLASATIFGLIAASPFVLQDLYGLTPQQYGWAFGGLGLVLIVSAQLNPRLLRRFGLVRTQLGLLVVAVLSALAQLLAVGFGVGGVWGFLLPMIGLGTIPAQQANSSAIALHHHGARAGTAAAVLGAARFGVGGIVSPLVGLLVHGSAAPLAVLLLATTTAGLVLVVVMRRRLQDHLDD